MDRWGQVLQYNILAERYALNDIRAPLLALERVDRY